MTHSIQVVNKVQTSIASSLVREQLCTPKQAIATGVIFASNLDNLLLDSSEWLFQVSNMLDDATVDGEPLEVFPALDALVRIGVIEFLLGTKVLVATEKLINLIDSVGTAYAPYLAKDGVVERRRDYASNKVSPLFKEAIHALESSKYTVSDVMLQTARDVYKLMNDKQKMQFMKENDYKVKGASAMDSNEAYVSEFFGDFRERIYQACAHGPNGQAGDLERSLMDLYGVSMDYDVDYTMGLIMEEMEDMGNWDGYDDMESDIRDAVSHPADFIYYHMEGLNHIKKPWNFVKFANIYVALLNGEKPYIGVAVGLDAKCSGPQLAALMVADQKMLASTGFTMKQLDDAYHNCIVSLESRGIHGFSRSDIKKPFMAVFYGAGELAMTDIQTIEEGAWNILYANKPLEAYEDIAADFHKAIVASFGIKLNTLRASIKQEGFDYDMDVAKYNKAMEHTMPDGCVVRMDYKIQIDINGDIIEYDAPQTITVVKSGLISQSFKNLKFNTNMVDYAAYARKGFVNMIQATDALLARLIIVHAKRLGAQHIIAIHDCFRVNIHDMAILQEAIKQAYLDLFSNMKNEATKDLPLGTDILGMYFEGSKEATKDEYKEACHYHSQFFKNGTRHLRAVNGVFFKELVNSLGTTYYFAK